MFFGQFLLSLYDFYFSSLGFPIVPVTGTVLCVASTLLISRSQQTDPRKKHRTLLIGLLLVCFFFISSLWGLAAFKTATIKGPAGISFGILIYCIMTLQEENATYKDWIFRFLNIILVFHLIFWFIQFLDFVIFHNFLDFLKPITGTQTRHGAPLQDLVTSLTRFTGLFAEPAAYSTFIFMGVTTRMIRNAWRLQLFDGLLIFSVLASLAITGIFLVLIILGVWGFKVLRTRRAWAIMAAVFVLIGIFLLSQINSPYMKLIIFRLQTPSSDASVRIRTEDAMGSYTRLPEIAQIFGAGFGNYGVSENVSNGVLNLLIFLGILGTALVVVLFTWLLRQRRFPGWVWLFLTVTLPFAPPFTLQYWWFWIGMMVLFGQDQLRSQAAITANLDAAHGGENQLPSGTLSPPTLMG
ncbi:MAG TPA: hypothetical protein VKU00_26080 [Chthonomonadaceae bacterium]|nr:hypothetical protein [Chthonomonadaceae bacterium]